MSQDIKNPESKPKPPLPARGEELSLDWFTDVFLPQYGKQAGIAIGAIAAIVLAVFAWNIFQSKSEESANKKLGKAYMYLSSNQTDSAAASLEDVLKEGPGGIAGAKAYFLLGKIRYNQGRFDDAIKAYEAVNVSSSGYPLIASGALHGSAAAHMEKGEWKIAAEKLEEYVKDFGKRTGSPKERLAQQEVADAAPVVPNALWKLVLCYRELKDDAKAKATAERLVKIYPESREGADATRLLAQL